MTRNRHSAVPRAEGSKGRDNPTEIHLRTSEWRCNEGSYTFVQNVSQWGVSSSRTCYWTEFETKNFSKLMSDSQLLRRYGRFENKVCWQDNCISNIALVFLHLTHDFGMYPLHVQSAQVLQPTDALHV